MNYGEKLKDPRWQKKRLEVFKRDDFTCKYCGDKGSTLHVHHYKYMGDPWDVELEDLDTLCEHCHTVAEDVKRFRIVTAIKTRPTDNIILLYYTIKRDNHIVLVIAEFIDGKYTNSISDFINGAENTIAQLKAKMSHG